MPCVRSFVKAAPCAGASPGVEPSYVVRTVGQPASVSFFGILLVGILLVGVFGILLVGLHERGVERGRGTACARVVGRVLHEHRA